MTKQAIQQLAKDYDTACSNYCKAMVAMWQVVVFNDYLADDYYNFRMGGIDYALCIEDVRYVVHNRISAEDVEEWHAGNNQQSLRDYMYFRTLSEIICTTNENDL